MDSTPFVSIVMPIRNEADFIARSLTAVLEQDYPHDSIEVLIADGMSSDQTREIVADVAAAHPHIPVMLLDNPGQIVPTGLNRAIARARGDIIIRVDGHCEIASDYVSRCVHHLSRDRSISGVGGPIETIGHSQLSQTIAIAMSSNFGVGASAFRTVKDRTMLVDSVAFPAYTRHAIEMAGPYDEELVRNQDDEYNYRLRSLGCNILLASDIRSRYYSRSSLRSLWRQHFQYGYWKVRVMQKHPRQMQPRQFAPPLFALTLLGGPLLTPFSKLLRGLWLAALVFYALANISASLYAARRAGWHHLSLLPLVYATLHVSYGLGFLIGLVKFRHRWAATGERELDSSKLER